MQPGSDGTSATNTPSSSCSMSTRYFISHLRPDSAEGFKPACDYTHPGAIFSLFDVASPSDVEAAFAWVASVAGDRRVVGLAPGACCAEGREHRVEGVAAAVAHDAEAVRGRDADVRR